MCGLQKGCGYHLDLLVVAVMLGVCSIMGLPWFVAATVLSISHVNSLKLESECAAPGEQPKFLGIREQRVTGFMIFFLMGCSVFMTSVLKVSRQTVRAAFTPRSLAPFTDRFFAFTVHPDARPVRRVPLHGRVLAQRHPGTSLRPSVCPADGGVKARLTSRASVCPTAL